MRRRSRNPDLHKGAIEDEHPCASTNAPGLDEDGLPNDEVAIANDVRNRTCAFRRLCYSRPTCQNAMAIGPDFTRTESASTFQRSQAFQLSALVPLLPPWCPEARLLPEQTSR
jgi:hypothetical protein